MRWLLTALLATAVGAGLLGVPAAEPAPGPPSDPWSGAASGPEPSRTATTALTAQEDAPTPVGPLGSLPPRPALVEAAPDAEAGRLVVEPPVVWLDLAPGMSAQPRLTVTNGSADVLSLEVGAVPLVAGSDGAPTPLGSTVGVEDDPSVTTSPSAEGETGATDPPPEPASSVVRWVLLAERSLHLGASERAHLWPSVGVPRDADAEAVAAAVRLRASGGPEVAAVVAVDPGGAPPEVEVSAVLERSGAAEAVARLTLRSAGLTSVEGTLTVRSWWGSTIVDVEVPPTLVLPDVPRTQQVAFRAPAVPGPYRLAVDLAPRRGSTATAADRTVLWNPLAVAVGALLVAVAAFAIVFLRRRTWT